jgi:hypothetical protein
MSSFTLVSTPALSVVVLCITAAIAISAAAVLAALAFQQWSDAKNRAVQNRLKEQLQQMLAQMHG